MKYAGRTAGAAIANHLISNQGVNYAQMFVDTFANTLALEWAASAGQGAGRTISSEGPANSDQSQIDQNNLNASLYGEHVDPLTGALVPNQSLGDYAVYGDVNSNSASLGSGTGTGLFDTNSTFGSQSLVVNAGAGDTGNAGSLPPFNPNAEIDTSSVHLTPTNVNTNIAPIDTSGLTPIDLSSIPVIPTSQLDALPPLNPISLSTPNGPIDGGTAQALEDVRANGSSASVADIKSVQQLLVDQNLNLGDTGQNTNGVDGIWGPKSTAALNLYTAQTDLQSPQVQALLTTIQQREGGQYNIGYGGVQLTDLSQHPGLIFKGPDGTMVSAAGAYQITNGTWQSASKALGGLPDFSAGSQDLAAAYLLRNTGAVTALENGSIQQAIQDAGKQWDSMPVALNLSQTEGLSNWGHQTWTFGQIQDLYNSNLDNALFADNALNASGLISNLTPSGNSLNFNLLGGNVGSTQTFVPPTQTQSQTSSSGGFLSTVEQYGEKVLSEDVTFGTHFISSAVSETGSLIKGAANFVGTAAEAQYNPLAAYETGQTVINTVKGIGNLVDTVQGLQYGNPEAYAKVALAANAVETAYNAKVAQEGTAAAWGDIAGTAAPYVASLFVAPEDIAAAGARGADLLGQAGEYLQPLFQAGNLTGSAGTIGTDLIGQTGAVNLFGDGVRFSQIRSEGSLIGGVGGSLAPVNVLSTAGAPRIEDINRATALDFYMNQAGFTEERALQHIGGIDLTQPVTVTMLDSGTILQQYARLGELGNYFAPVGTTPLESGLTITDQSIGVFQNEEAVTALQSISKPDYLYPPGEIVPGSGAGGGIQYFIPNKAAFNPVP